MKRQNRVLAALLCLLLTLGTLAGCDLFPVQTVPKTESVVLSGADTYTMKVGDELQLEFSSLPATHEVVWTASNDSVRVDEQGYVTAISPGTARIFAFVGDLYDSVQITVISSDGNQESNGGNTTTGNGSAKPDPDPKPLPDYTNKDAFYRNYYPAVSYEDAINRSKYGLMSGELEVPDQEPTLSSNRPKSGTQYIRNDEPWFADSNTYVVVNSRGEEAFRVYRGGAYITLEEVAAYVYAFGSVPANYVNDKDAAPEDSIWGKYLRLNNSYFSGDTSIFPYEPVLPGIQSCGGNLKYYEIDIGTTGTSCGSGYPFRTYNNGRSIVRGAARIVYVRYSSGGSITDPNRRYVFYTYNHYNDFQEYLNYEGGWGEMFGNITGGGTLSSNTHYNPTDYVPVVMASLTSRTLSVEYTVFCPTLLFCAVLNKEFAAA